MSDPSLRDLQKFKKIFTENLTPRQTRITVPP